MTTTADPGQWSPVVGGLVQFKAGDPPQVGIALVCDLWGGDLATLVGRVGDKPRRLTLPLRKLAPVAVPPPDIGQYVRWVHRQPGSTYKVLTGQVVKVWSATHMLWADVQTLQGKLYHVVAATLLPMPGAVVGGADNE